MTATADDAPLAGAWVRLALHTTEKNDYNLLFGPADGGARLVVLEGELMDQTERIRNFFLMDYAGIESWDRTMTIAVLNREDVGRLLGAIDLWGIGVAVKSETDLERLKAYGDTLTGMAEARLRVHVEVEPPEGADVTAEVSLA
jgi:chloramphenicol 3-O-phosphotransferase